MTVAAQTLLDKVETAIEAILDGGAVQSYSIGGRNLQRMTLPDLRSLRNELKKEVAAANTDTTHTTNFARFNRPV